MTRARRPINFVMTMLAMYLIGSTTIGVAQQQACSQSQQDTCPANSPIGSFVVVDMRKASGVVSGPVATESAEPIGATVEFSASSLSIQGMACDDWDITNIDAPVDLNDPLLSDVNIGPIDGEASTGDKRILASFSYSCEGEQFLDVLQIDKRVLVVPWANSALNLILERPLTSEEVVRSQAALQDAKFYDGDLSGELDQATIDAIGRWAEYRNTASEAYYFARTAITENLFDGLDVFE